MMIKKSFHIAKKAGFNLRILPLLVSQSSKATLAAVQPKQEQNWNCKQLSGTAINIHTEYRAGRVAPGTGSVDSLTGLFFFIIDLDSIDGGYKYPIINTPVPGPRSMVSRRLAIRLLSIYNSADVL